MKKQWQFRLDSIKQESEEGGRQHLLAYRLPTLPVPDFIGVHPNDLPYE